MAENNYSFVELSAPTSHEWLLISSPFSLLIIIVGYLYFVLYAGPHYMKDRSPYKLRTFILLYNFIQILANLWIVKELITSDWFLKYGILYAEPMSDSPNAFKVFNAAWWFLILKIFDLVETCVFTLRKKQNQVSTLHVYHHVSNIFFGWLYLKYLLDERMAFILLLNCAVHVIMYIYYLISALGPKYQQIISPIKPFITKIQMVQFLAMMTYTLQIYNPVYNKQAKYSLAIIPMFIGNLIIFLYMFYNFYRKSYTNIKIIQKRIVKFDNN